MFKRSLAKIQAGESRFAQSSGRGDPAARRIQRAFRRLSVATNLRRRLAREDGGATVEFVLWTPLYVALIGFVADVSLSITQTSMMWDVARDTSRRVAVGELEPEAAETYAKSQLPPAETTIVSVQYTGTNDVNWPLFNLKMHSCNSISTLPTV